MMIVVMSFLEVWFEEFFSCLHVPDHHPNVGLRQHRAAVRGVLKGFGAPRPFAPGFCRTGRQALREPGAAGGGPFSPSTPTAG